MPAFIDPDATGVFTVRSHASVCKREGECECPPVCLCPGSPHPFDTVTAKSRIGIADMAKISRSMWVIDQEIKLMEVAITAWSFVDQSGKPVPIGAPTIALLDPELGQEIAQWIDREIGKAKLPNGFGGRSQPESPASSAAPTTSTTP